jgi:hypothetical protein
MRLLVFHLRQENAWSKVRNSKKVYLYTKILQSNGVLYHLACGGVFFIVTWLPAGQVKNWLVGSQGQKMFLFS